MNTFRRIAIALGFCLFLGGVPIDSYAQTTTPSTWEATVEIDISVNATGYVGKSHQPITGWFRVATGSGTIIDGDRGYVLTNNHVVELSLVKYLDQYPRITVTVQPNQSNFRLVYAGIIVGRDKPIDIAVLKLINPLNPNQLTHMGLPQVTLGDSSGLNIGDPIFIVGNPYGVGKSVSAGIVSALNRGEGTREELVQTDAALNPGNSGGGAFDSNGKLVGIPVEIFSKSGGSAGVGFFIPINIVVNELGQLIIYHHVIHAALGAHIYIPNGLYVQNGVTIADVDPNSGAAHAGLKPGDIILKLGSTIMFTVEDVVDYLTYARPNDKVVVTVYRNKKTLSLPVTLDAIPEDTSVSPDDGSDQ